MASSSRTDQDRAAGTDAVPKAAGVSEDVPGVRFASEVQEISPNKLSTEDSVQRHDALTSNVDATDEELRAAAKSIGGTGLQERRMNTYQFEAFSLPPSRVPSREDDSADSSRLPTPISAGGFQSPGGSPRLSALASPPLTPSGSGPSEKRRASEAETKSLTQDPHTITPQPSTSHEGRTPVAERTPLPHRPASDQVLRRSSSADGRHGDTKSHRRGLFGAGSGSVPVSRETSPSRSSASHFYSKPMAAVGDVNDPYAKGRRPPQSHTTKTSIDPRFVFSRKKKHGSPGGSKSSLSEKRGSGIFGSKNGSEEVVGGDHHANGSTVDLKRFFRKPGHHHHGHHQQKKRDASPAPTKTSTKSSLPASRSTHQLPFGDDHGLESKYGKLGKVLGSGAGGSVRLMKRKEDNTVFAVKEFRARHTYETEKDYNKKVTAEFCVGSTLHHGNIIETLDILQEKGRWFEVMEYAPFDLFAIVMTGKMTREEVRCSFLQILNGVTYLHSLGLAHRDLKLDNVVVNDRGIMKIIDFGSAHVFKYPFESGTVPAKGIVGSDPYLAPEVYEVREYDAAAVDIWSLAIIFCCMSLRRFPWKIPKLTDNSYKLFAAEPTPGHDPKMLVQPKTPSHASSVSNGGEEGSKDSGSNHHHHHHKREESSSASPATETQSQAPSSSSGQKEVIRGPWRILRLLPRESRRIIYRMLDTNPKTRAGMDEVLDESWVADTVICQQLEDGATIPAEDHTHVLEPPSSQPA